jgi:hypothetical protein
MRGPLTKIRYQAFLAVRLGAQLKNMLLPHQVHGQSAGDEIREFVGRGVLEILGIVVEDERVAGFVEFDEFALHGRAAGSFAVFQIIHAACEKRLALKEVQHAEGRAANGEDVHAAVVVTLYDVENFSGAADVSEAIGQRKEHPEFGMILDAGFDHLAVARFENVQGEFRAGEKDDVQGEKRNAIRPHGPRSNDTRGAGEMYGAGVSGGEAS